MGATGIKGYTGSSRDGSYNISNGIIQSSGGSSAASPKYELNGFSLSPGPGSAGLISSGTSAFADEARAALNDYYTTVSGFNASEAAKARNWSAAQNQLAMATSAAEAQKNRDWQERMSNTAHQREVQDLVKAGLNPVLSSLAGATTPAGSAGQGYTSSASSASADTSGNALMSLFANVLNNATAVEMQKEQLAATRGIADLNASVDLQGYASSLQGALASAGAVYGAAQLNSAAQMYGYDKSYEGILSKIADDQFRQSMEIGFKKNEAALDRSHEMAIAQLNNQSKYDTSLLGMYSQFLKGMGSSVGVENPTAFLGKKFVTKTGDLAKKGINAYNNRPSGGGYSRGF